MGTVLPLMAGASSVIATGAVLYRITRPWFAVTVNCHFCNRDTQVPYGNQNCWDCLYCDQYNGFAQDGDYNKPIPSQYVEDMNHPISAEQRTPVDFNTGSSHILCDFCTRNQLLKVKQVANFIPYEENNYSAEVEAYQAHLEHVYRLCRGCEKKVNRVVHKQDQLLHSKLEESSAQRCDPYLNTSDHSFTVLCCLVNPWHVQFLRTIAFVCGVVILVSSGQNSLTFSFHTLPWGYSLLVTWMTAVYDLSTWFVCVGLVSNTAAVYLAGKERLLGADAIGCFLWVVLMLLLSSSVMIKLPRGDLFMVQAVTALLTCSVILWSLLSPRYMKAASPKRIRVRQYRPDTSGVSSTSSPEVTPQSTPAPSVLGEVEQSEVETEPAMTNFETMSIGSASSIRKPGMFSACAYGPADPKLSYDGVSSSQNIHVPSLATLRYQRPIISPARFQPTAVERTLNLELPKNVGPRARAPCGILSKTENSGRFGSMSLLCSQPLNQISSSSGRVSGFDDQASLFSEPRNHGDDSSDSSSSSSHSFSRASSVCPVDTTYTEVDPRTMEAHIKRKSFRSYIFWGLSIGLNIGLLAYFLIDFSKIAEYLS